MGVVRNQQPAALTDPATPLSTLPQPTNGTTALQQGARAPHPTPMPRLPHTHTHSPQMQAAHRLALLLGSVHRPQVSHVGVPPAARGNSHSQPAATARKPANRPREAWHTSSCHMQCCAGGALPEPAACLRHWNPLCVAGTAAAEAAAGGRAFERHHTPHPHTMAPGRRLPAQAAAPAPPAAMGVCPGARRWARRTIKNQAGAAAAGLPVQPLAPEGIQFPRGAQGHPPAAAAPHNPVAGAGCYQEGACLQQAGASSNTQAPEVHLCRHTFT